MLVTIFEVLTLGTMYNKGTVDKITHCIPYARVQLEVIDRVENILAFHTLCTHTKDYNFCFSNITSALRAHSGGFENGYHPRCAGNTGFALVKEAIS